MIRVNIGDEDICLWFEHIKHESEYVYDCDVYLNEVPATVCKIYIVRVGVEVDPELIYSYGKVVLYKDDQYNKATGRKLALGKALEDGDFSRDDRALIWKGYFEQIKPKK